MSPTTNKNQVWYCKTCERDTKHVIDSVPSKHVTLREGIRAYQRCRGCSCCYGDTRTVEIVQSDFEKVCKELNSLRKFSEAIQQALDKTKQPRGKQAAG
jgi:ribosomal protein L44E